MSALTRRQPATVFLDRDGTINEKAPEGRYITRPEQLRLLPRAGEAVRLLNQAGVEVVIVTNQRGIARGVMTEDQYHSVTDALLTMLAAQAASVRAIYHCPHEVNTCICRKPAVGMIRRAKAEHPDLVLADGVMVGDAYSDVEAGRRAGLRTVLLAGPDGPSDSKLAADHVASTLFDAVRWMLR